MHAITVKLHRTGKWFVCDLEGNAVHTWLHSSHIRFPVLFATQQAAQRKAWAM